MAVRHARVIASGAHLAPLVGAAADIVICADGGLAAAIEAQLRVDVVVGDLDSASAADLDAAAAAGAEILRHPATKDETDLELALLEAMDRGAASIAVHLADGGRLDHQLANLVVLASPRWRSARVSAWVGENRVWVVHGELELPLAAGAAVALQAVAGPATVTTTGLAYPLHGEVLRSTEARGIANEVISAPATVRVDDGVVLVLSPPGQSAQAT
ncbi:MAG: thiamine diphosphokinase [Acidimicrobiales bacterium]